MRQPARFIPTPTGWKNAPLRCRHSRPWAKRIITICSSMFIFCRSTRSKSRCWARRNSRGLAQWNRCCPILRSPIEDPRPILGHEGIPGHFLQLSIANHLKDEIRRQHSDGIFIEGWALYGEEMLMRTGLYPLNSASQGQILRLARYRSARIGVDVNLHTGRWTFAQAVKYFMEAGGLDREAAEGEAAGAAASPTQKITYITGKWQIMRLLGKYGEKSGKDFRLGQFHDDLIKNGSLPLSIVEWILLDDSSSLDQALK